MKRNPKSDPLPFPIRLIPGVLALLCELTAVTAPNAPEIVAWIGIPLIGLTAWMVVGQFWSTALSAWNRNGLRPANPLSS